MLHDSTRSDDDTVNCWELRQTAFWKLSPTCKLMTVWQTVCLPSLLGNFDWFLGTPLIVLQLLSQLSVHAHGQINDISPPNLSLMNDFNELWRPERRWNYVAPEVWSIFPRWNGNSGETRENRGARRKRWRIYGDNFSRVMVKIHQQIFVINGCSLECEFLLRSHENF